MNLFEILEIKPTNRFSAVKQAFHAAMLMYHPDKHPDASEARKKELNKKCADLVFAWNYLRDQKNLIKYFHYITTNTGVDPLKQAQARTNVMSSTPHFTEVKENAVTEVRDKITVFVPMYVINLPHYIQKITKRKFASVGMWLRYLAERSMAGIPVKLGIKKTYSDLSDADFEQAKQGSAQMNI